jgi:CheY-like chemotaxis protein
MDMQMPVMDGITASMIIKEKGGIYDKLNIMILSASFEFEMKKHLNSGVICDYVLKPFVPSELLQKIEKYIF